MSRLEELRAAKAVMWTSIECAEPDKRAPLMNQWRAIEKDIASLSQESEKSGDSIDEISARRAARGGATSRPGKADRRQG